MNKTLGEILKELRKDSGLTAKDVSDKLKEIGFNISDKTLSGYENGIRMPNADLFMALCKIYNCKNILETFAYVNADYSIPTDAEWEIIERYRELDGTGQDNVKMALHIEQSRVKKEKELSNKIVSLEFENERLKRMKRYSYMHNIASAGIGFYYHDIPTDTMIAPYKEGADFIIGVSGDSMEPTFYDGDKVYVRKTSKLDVGKIGIFIYNDECFIKEKGGDCLISHNKKYPDMLPANDVRLIGEVIGKVEE